MTGRILVGADRREDPINAQPAASELPRGPGLPGAPPLSFLAGASVVRRAAVRGVGGFEPRLLSGGGAHHASRTRDPHLRRRQGIRNAVVRLRDDPQPMRSTPPG